MIQFADIHKITGASIGVSSNWPLLCSALQAQGIDYPNVRVAMAATIAVESMFNPQAVAPGAEPFRGRGLIQLTGEANYTTFGGYVGLDLIKHPELACIPHVSAEIAALFFGDHSITLHANRGDWHTVRRVVNGGLNGFDKFLSFVWPLLAAEYRYSSE